MQERISLQLKLSNDQIRTGGFVSFSKYYSRFAEIKIRKKQFEIFTQIRPVFDRLQLSTVQAATSTTAANGSIIIEEITGGTALFSFLWSNGETTQSITDLLPGFYSLTLTDGAGCVEVFDWEVSFTVAAKDVIDYISQVHLYPNPTAQKNEATLTMYSQTSQTIDFKLFDIAGRLLQKEEIRLPAGLFQKKIIAPAAAGVYLLQIIGEDGRRVYLRWVFLGK